MSSIFSSLNLKINRLKKRAKQKNIQFELDQEWVIKKLRKGRCEATGLKFNLNLKPYLNPLYPTIDRIDNSKGYTYDNCWVVCHMFNIAKADHNIKVFEYWANKYVKEYEKRNRR